METKKKNNGPGFKFWKSKKSAELSLGSEDKFLTPVSNLVAGANADDDQNSTCTSLCPSDISKITGDEGSYHRADSPGVPEEVEKAVPTTSVISYANINSISSEVEEKEERKTSSTSPSPESLKSTSLKEKPRLGNGSESIVSEISNKVGVIEKPSIEKAMENNMIDKTVRFTKSTIENESLKSNKNSLKSKNSGLFKKIFSTKTQTNNKRQNLVISEPTLIAGPTSASSLEYSKILHIERSSPSRTRKPSLNSKVNVKSGKINYSAARTFVRPSGVKPSTGNHLGSVGGSLQENRKRESSLDDLVSIKSKPTTSPFHRGKKYRTFSLGQSFKNKNSKNRLKESNGEVVHSEEKPKTPDLNADKKQQQGDIFKSKEKVTEQDPSPKTTVKKNTDSFDETSKTSEADHTDLVKKDSIPPPISMGNSNSVENEIYLATGDVRTHELPLTPTEIYEQKKAKGDSYQDQAGPIYATVKKNKSANAVSMTKNKSAPNLRHMGSSRPPPMIVEAFEKKKDTHKMDDSNKNMKTLSMKGSHIYPLQSASKIYVQRSHSHGSHREVEPIVNVKRHSRSFDEHVKVSPQIFSAKNFDYDDIDNEVFEEATPQVYDSSPCPHKYVYKSQSVERPTVVQTHHQVTRSSSEPRYNKTTVVRPTNHLSLSQMAPILTDHMVRHNQIVAKESGIQYEHQKNLEDKMAGPKIVEYDKLGFSDGRVLRSSVSLDSTDSAHSHNRQSPQTMTRPRSISFESSDVREFPVSYYRPDKEKLLAEAKKKKKKHEDKSPQRTTISFDDQINLKSQTKSGKWTGKVLGKTSGKSFKQQSLPLRKQTSFDICDISLEGNQAQQAQKKATNLDQEKNFHPENYLSTDHKDSGGYQQSWKTGECSADEVSSLKSTPDIPHSDESNGFRGPPTIPVRALQQRCQQQRQTEPNADQTGHAHTTEEFLKKYRTNREENRSHRCNHPNHIAIPKDIDEATSIENQEQEKFAERNRAAYNQIYGNEPNARGTYSEHYSPSSFVSPTLLTGFSSHSNRTPPMYQQPIFMNQIPVSPILIANAMPSFYLPWLQTHQISNPVSTSKVYQTIKPGAYALQAPMILSNPEEWHGTNSGSTGTKYLPILTHSRAQEVTENDVNSLSRGTPQMWIEEHPNAKQNTQKAVYNWVSHRLAKESPDIQSYYKKPGVRVVLSRAQNRHHHPVIVEEAEDEGMSNRNTRFEVRV